MEKLEEKPVRKALRLRLEHNRPYEVTDFDLDAFVAEVMKRRPSEKPPSTSEFGPVHRNLYPVPDNTDFLKSVAESLKKYKPMLAKDQKEASCKRKSSFAHHQVLAAYFNARNPYRGILVYHGMGSGKTCSSVALAEKLGGKETRPIWVLTPHALESNYRAEMVKCSKVYRSAQHWASRKEGWVVLPKKEPNFDELGPREQQEVMEQLKTVVDREGAYKFVSFSGLNCANIHSQFAGESNPFEHSVVVIDEVHTLVKHIAANLNNSASPYPLLYEWLMDAADCRVIALSGTPRVSKVTDLGILFNIVHGYIKVWTLKTPKLVEDRRTLRFVHQQVSDGETVKITRTPFGFEAVYDENGALRGLNKVDDVWDDHRFKTELSKVGPLSDNAEKHKLLPDHEESFVPPEVFQERIQGLTSYFPDISKLMPPLLPARVHHAEVAEAFSKEAVVHTVFFPKEVPRIKKAKVDACGAEENAGKREEEVRKTLHLLRERNVFAKLETYSPKLKLLVDHLGKTPNRHFVFSQFSENVEFAAEALVHNLGYAAVKLSAPNPPEQLQWTVAPAPKTKRRLVVYAGSEPEKQLLLETFNRGEADIFLCSLDGVEGISLQDVEHVHLLEPPADPSVTAQIVGRARRMCKNTTDAGVTPHFYLCGEEDKEVYQQAEKKKKEMDRWLELVRETAVDCPLSDGKKCYVAHKSKVYDVSGEKRVLFQAPAVDKKGTQKWVPLFEKEDDVQPVGYQSFEKDDELEVGEPTFYDRDEKPVAGVAALLPPVKKETVVEKRKRLKIETKAGVHFAYVSTATGEQPLYKTKDGDELYGFVDFGPPRTFLDVYRKGTTAEKLFSASFKKV